MTGVKAFIRDNLPKSWEQALRDKKCLGCFIEQFYQAIAKPKNRNKYHYNISIMQARHEMRCMSINCIAIYYKFKEGPEFWNEVARLVSNYELQWK